MDATAIALCRENQIPIHVFNLFKKGALLKAVMRKKRRLSRNRRVSHDRMTKQVEAKMQATLEHFKQELKNLRTNRANPGMVEGVTVEVYGSHMHIKELANITTPESRQILISPFDPQTAGAIAKGIEKANLNLQPVVEGHVDPHQRSSYGRSDAQRDRQARARKKPKMPKSPSARSAARAMKLIRKQKADGDHHRRRHEKRRKGDPRANR